MKALRSFVILLITLLSLFNSFSTLVHAVEPTTPFSKEGNPPKDYYYDKLFPLFRYIKPAKLKVYENKDRSRKYEALQICPGDGHDRRDYNCSVDLGTGKTVDPCSGGEVDLCYKGDRSGVVAQIAHSGPNSSCRINRNKLPDDASGVIPGKCDYRQTPKNNGDPITTDFAEIMRSANSTDGSTTESSPAPSTPPTGTEGSQTPATQTTVGLVYAKLQNEQMYYGGSGTDNPLTWGIHRLQLSQGEQAILQLLVVIRAKQTKDTLSKTCEWPLGWVDWGYQTANGKTLLEIRDELPGDIAGAGQAIVESADDLFLNAANLGIISDVSAKKELVAKRVAEESSKANPPEWVTDLLQAPVYPPSFRQGYTHASICIWNNCCPGNRCGPYAAFLSGNSNALYADTSVSQAFNASLYDLFLNYPLKEAAKIFKDLAAGNQLIRFAGSSAENATPTKIHERLSKEVQYDCFKYVPGPSGFDWSFFTLYMDYADPPTFLDPDKKCPGWAIQPELTKETAGAVPQSLLASLISLLIGGSKVDDVEPVKYHLITIPDAMGQYLSEVEDPVLQIRDTLTDNEKQNDYYDTESNIVATEGDPYFSGKGWAVGNAKRRTGLFSCADIDYSSPEQTSIEAYALGTRVGCFDETAISGGKCTGEQFTKIIGDVTQTPLPEAVETVMNSKMFVNNALNPDLAEAYAQVEKETGVPCEVLAAHHFEEAFGTFFGDKNPGEYSAANGGYVGKNGFLESVRNAAKGVLRHPPTSPESLITEMSDFNGGGNSNCQTINGVSIPWGGCPRQFIGEDDPYATNLMDSRHTGMYLVYCGDFKICNPLVPYGSRPGAFPVAIAIHNAIKDGSTSSGTDSSSSPSPSPSPKDNVLKVNAKGKCGDGYIDTGLGCLPYNRDALISALLGFIAGISGLIALGTMLAATFQIMTAAGDTKKLEKGKELFGAAVAGLLFVIFSVTLLRIIAGDIIKIPGF